MAEATVASMPRRFYCHQCLASITPILPDYTCPQCQSGFIEELQLASASSDDSSESDDPAQAIAETVSRTLVDSLSSLTSLRSAFNLDSSPPSSSDGSTGSSSSSSTSTQPPTRRRHSAGLHNYNTRSTNRRRWRNPDQQGTTPLEQILTNLTGFGWEVSVDGLPLPAGLAPVVLNLHGNPGDYAWGRHGLDTIITQLLNQLDYTGPPPMSQDNIHDIPTVSITQEDVNNNLQCSVCFEDFKLAEPVRQLNCEHQFHNDCIVPWLELHGTCPICRQLLPGADGGRHSQT